MDYENIMSFNDKFSITFIGMPGTGKSFTSKILSEKYNIPVIELDTIIENNYKMPLQDIINKYGEKEFKTIEKNAILNVKPEVLQGENLFCKNKLIGPTFLIVKSLSIFLSLSKDSRLSSLQITDCSDLNNCAFSTETSIKLKVSPGFACPNFQNAEDGTVYGLIKPPMLGPSLTSIIGV